MSMKFTELHGGTYFRRQTSRVRHGHGLDCDLGGWPRSGSGPSASTRRVSLRGATAARLANTPHRLPSLDALKGIRHACEHNLIAIASGALAIGVAAVLKEHCIPGRVLFWALQPRSRVEASRTWSRRGL